MATASDAYSCKMTGKWDWSESGTTGSNQGKHTEGREIYLLDSRRLANVGDDEDLYGFEVIERRNKVRGHGKALVLRFDSVPGKDFEILGWALDITGTNQ